MVVDPIVTERIRAIFLHHESRVTVAEAAAMLGWSRAAMNAAIRDGDIELVGTCSGNMIELRELVSYALQQWPLAAVEKALGREAALILPPALRTRKFTVRLPLYQIAALRALAEDGGEPVDVMLTRMFEELADISRDQLLTRVPGLEEAIGWPTVAESGRAS
ncbi:MAG TPA: hypothetical protein VF846_09415 [Thermoanaerobaculia bacterium]|jgi:hypothetical protein